MIPLILFCLEFVLCSSKLLLQEGVELNEQNEGSLLNEWVVGACICSKQYKHMEGSFQKKILRWLRVFRSPDVITVKQYRSYLQAMPMDYLGKYSCCALCHVIFSPYILKTPFQNRHWLLWSEANSEFDRNDAQLDFQDFQGLCCNSEWIKALGMFLVIKINGKGSFKGRNLLLSYRYVTEEQQFHVSSSLSLVTLEY